MLKIDFEPVGLRGEMIPGQTILDIAREMKVDIVNICGGGGSCGRCKVQVLSGNIPEPADDDAEFFSEEELAEGWRLACKTVPLSDVKVYIPLESLTAPQRTQVEGISYDVAPDPPVKRYELALEKPSLENPRSDAANLWTALAMQDVPEGRIDFCVLQSLPDTIRENEWNISVAVRDDEIVAVNAAETRYLGLAVDIGTTKIAGYLIDLVTGETLGSKGAMNPQILYGEDVVSRIMYASKTEDNAQKLQTLLVDSLNELAESLCAEVDAAPVQVVEAVVVCNTAIHHLFLKMDSRQLGLSPFIPAQKKAMDVKARDLGLMFSPGSYVHLLPNIAGYVGADHTSMLSAVRIEEEDGNVLAIDIGTNTEICLKSNGTLTSTSCASGPAFEGAHIKFGMRAAPGAIEYIQILDGEVRLQIIGDEEPVGICGSGLLDAAAQLKLNGLVNRMGRLQEGGLVQEIDGRLAFVLAAREGKGPLVLTQKDIRELQLAKGAIRLGIQALVENAGITEQDIDKVVIAGAFGSYIDVSSAITIGMLPNLPLETFTQVGNAAGTGARICLVSKAERQKAKVLAEKISYLELAKINNFNRKFAEATYL